MIKRSRGITGFTLLELLVVVAIIGILAAIAIPQFASYRQKTYNTAAQTNLRSIKTYLEFYFEEHQRYP